MKLWSSRRFLALFLGVFLALGMGLSAVQAGEMSVQMAMPSDAGAAGQSDCTGCNGGDDSSNAATSSSVLSCSSAAVLPDRKSVVTGKCVSVRVDLCGRRIIKKKNKTKEL